MIRKRNHIALLFLFCLCFLSLPKKWVHDCHSHEELLEIHDGIELNEDCHFCSYEFQADSPADLSIPAPFFRYLTCIVRFEPCEAPSIFVQQLHNKAPPSLPC